MNVLEAIQTRRSIRAFQQRAIEPGKLRTVLEAVRQAPSAGNLQAFHVHVVRDEANKRALAAAALGQEFLASAPVVLVFAAQPSRSAKYGRRGAELYCIQDATIAVTYAQLAAAELGLATCWIGAFDEAVVARGLRLPATERPVTILPLGYAAESPNPKSRRALEDLVTGLD
jgi:nitroreductase